MLSTRVNCKEFPHSLSLFTPIFISRWSQKRLSALMGPIKALPYVPRNHRNNRNTLPNPYFLQKNLTNPALALTLVDKQLKTLLHSITIHSKKHKTCIPGNSGLASGSGETLMRVTEYQLPLGTKKFPPMTIYACILKVIPSEASTRSNNE